MPFLVTTKRPDRTVVATLEEARDYIARGADRGGCLTYDQLTSLDATVTESGGMVGPLPDGTLITVEATTWGVIFDALPNENHWPRTLQAALKGDREAQDDLCAAFNARQEAVA